MAEPADSGPSSAREAAERLFLAGVGVAALTKDRVDELVDALVQKGSLSQTEARGVVDELVGRWRSEGTKLSERAGGTLSTFFRERGLVTRRVYEELDLRLALVEHRLRLLEKQPEA